MRHLPARQRRSKPNTRFPFQGHTAFAGAHATADPSNGQMTVYSNDMKSYGMRRGVATFLGMPQEQVRVIWMQGPQGFGRTAAEDAACEAAWIAREIGRPVRMQWMRDEETAWDTKSPGLPGEDARSPGCEGRLIAYDYKARSCDHNHLGYNEPDTVLIAQLMGSRRPRPAGGSASMPSDMYVIPNRKMAGEVVGLPIVWETPLRTGNLRDPNGPQATFAAESFIDEAAAAAKADPLEFRMKMIRPAPAMTPDSGGRDRWQCSRPPPTPMAGIRGRRRKRSATADILTGRGDRVLVPRPDHRRADRRGRSESSDWPCMGEAPGVRA